MSILTISEMLSGHLKSCDECGGDDFCNIGLPLWEVLIKRLKADLVGGE